MNVDEITIGQARELSQMFGGSDTKMPSTATKDHGVQIVALQRGWIVVGHVFQNGSDFRIENAAIVRRWGTTNGLGELAEQGPLAETVLDDCPAVMAHELTIVLRMSCDRDKWGDRRV